MPNLVGLERGHLRPLGALDNLHPDGLAILETGQAGAFQGGGMNENVLPAVLRADEAKALVAVVPLDRASHLDGRTQINASAWPLRPSWRRAACITPRRDRAGRALIHGDDLVDLAAFLPLPYPDLQCRARTDLLPP